MDAVLGLVLFDQVSLGFMVLLLGMLGLSTFVVVTTAYFLYTGRRSFQEKDVSQQPNDNDKEDEKELGFVQIV
jgi:hypothetical protein